MTPKFNILVLNGPNLNLLGIREPEKYDYTTLPEIIEELIQYSNQHYIKLSHLQSNAEFKLIDRIHEAKGKEDYIILNPAAFTHTSIALRDALLGVNIPFIEIHLTNIYSRESFRHHSYFSDISSGIICGLGIDGYKLALQTVIKRLFNCN